MCIRDRSTWGINEMIFNRIVSVIHALINSAIIIATLFIVLGYAILFRRSTGRVVPCADMITYYGEAKAKDLLWDKWVSFWQYAMILHYIIATIRLCCACCCPNEIISPDFDSHVEADDRLTVKERINLRSNLGKLQLFSLNIVSSLPFSIVFIYKFIGLNHGACQSFAINPEGMLVFRIGILMSHWFLTILIIILIFACCFGCIFAARTNDGHSTSQKRTILRTLNILFALTALFIGGVGYVVSVYYIVYSQLRTVRIWLAILVVAGLINFGIALYIFFKHPQIMDDDIEQHELDDELHHTTYA
eukprot:TRINITY_DN2136_c0_g1_i1.p1 TRINITY_DN2136_c0_g1~~TRINITY_DN2136_c0_g1_i1.p1  ORF type:complete len:305 (-),score=40.73 TRINITY_DN2136_c0_g1_i1:93-1007(-)